MWPSQDAVGHQDPGASTGPSTTIPCLGDRSESVTFCSSGPEMPPGGILPERWAIRICIIMGPDGAHEPVCRSADSGYKADALFARRHLASHEGEEDGDDSRPHPFVTTPPCLAHQWICRDCDRPRPPRSLRRHFLHGFPADPGDRDTHGARCRRGRCAATDCGQNPFSRDLWCRTGTGRNASGEQPSALFALWHLAKRCDDQCCGGHRPLGLCRGSRVHSSAARLPD